MGTIWLRKDKKRLYEQVNFASESETEDGTPMLCLKNLDGTSKWWPREMFTEVTFEDVERAFIRLGWSF